MSLIRLALQLNQMHMVQLQAPLHVSYKCLDFIIYKAWGKCRGRPPAPAGSQKKMNRLESVTESPFLDPLAHEGPSLACTIIFILAGRHNRFTYRHNFGAHRKGPQRHGSSSGANPF